MEADGGGLFVPARDGVVVTVRLTPKARRVGVEGLAHGADGATRLKVAVSAPPVEGRANADLIALLAKEWDVPKSAISIAAGGGSRDKRLRVAGDPAALLTRLNDWMERKGV